MGMVCSTPTITLTGIPLTISRQRESTLVDTLSQYRLIVTPVATSRRSRLPIDSLKAPQEGVSVLRVKEKA